MARLPVSVLVLAALLAPLAHAANGPYAGTLAQGETDTHEFDNNPSGDPCIQLATTWRVTLAYAPPTDTLTLQVGSLTATGSGGVARVTFVAGVCTAFTMQVTGSSVAQLAAYTISTQSFAPADPAALEWG